MKTKTGVGTFFLTVMVVFQLSPGLSRSEIITATSGGVPDAGAPGEGERCAECLTVPLLVSPSDGETIDNLIPLLTWNCQSDPNATGSRLQVATDYEFVHVIFSSSLPTHTGIAQSRYSYNLTPATTYYWHTCLRCGTEYGPYSETWSFTAGQGGTILSAPQTISPLDGSTVCLSDGKITVSWAAVSDAIEYELVQSRAGSQNSYIYKTSATARELTSLEVDGTHTWRVCARNDYAFGDFSPTAVFRHNLTIAGGDYDGDGSADVAVFRDGQGLWAVRGLTRIYFGGDGDLPVPGDYDGDGTTEAGVWRYGDGLWIVRDVTRVYHGLAADLPVPGDYDGDGSCDVAVFRPAEGLWAVRGITQTHFGVEGDSPLPADFNGDGTSEIAVFRSGNGLWAWRGVTRLYFGITGDWPLGAELGPDPNDEPVVFRGSLGVWTTASGSRWYFGKDGDTPVPASYLGAEDTCAVFRPTAGLWALRGATRYWFGVSGDLPVTR